MHERCEKYPSLDRLYCAHCQGLAVAQPQNPEYSLVDRSDEAGGPFVEILENGGPIHTWDSHFKFSLLKAKMLLTCLPVLQEFGWASDQERAQFQSSVMEDPAREIRVQIEMYLEFENSRGAKIERPWLKLQALPPHNADLGLGARKCRAVWSVRDRLDTWVALNVLRSLVNRLRPASENNDQVRGSTYSKPSTDALFHGRLES